MKLALSSQCNICGMSLPSKNTILEPFSSPQITCDTCSKASSNTTATQNCSGDARLKPKGNADVEITREKESHVLLSYLLGISEKPQPRIRDSNSGVVQNSECNKAPYNFKILRRPSICSLQNGMAKMQNSIKTGRENYGQGTAGEENDASITSSQCKIARFQSGVDRFNMNMDQGSQKRASQAFTYAQQYRLTEVKNSGHNGVTSSEHIPTSGPQTFGVTREQNLFESGEMNSARCNVLMMSDSFIKPQQNNAPGIPQKATGSNIQCAEWVAKRSTSQEKGNLQRVCGVCKREFMSNTCEQLHFFHSRRCVPVCYSTDFITTHCIWCGAQFNSQHLDSSPDCASRAAVLHTLLQESSSCLRCGTVLQGDAERTAHYDGDERCLMAFVSLVHTRTCRNSCFMCDAMLDGAEARGKGACACVRCGVAFASPTTRMQHLVRNSECMAAALAASSGAAPCIACNACFPSAAALATHHCTSRTRLPCPPSSCAICHAQFTTYQHLHNHILHSPTCANSFPCIGCNQSFPTLIARTHHLQSSQLCHTAHLYTTFPTLLTPCGKRFASVEDYKKHLALHTATDNLWRCEGCCAAVATALEWKEHLQDNTECNQLTRMCTTMKCRKCYLYFSSPDILKLHLTSSKCSGDLSQSSTDKTADPSSRTDTHTCVNSNIFRESKNRPSQSNFIEHRKCENLVNFVTESEGQNNTQPTETDFRYTDSLMKSHSNKTFVDQFNDKILTMSSDGELGEISHAFMSKPVTQNVTVFLCGICSVQFPTKSDLEKHMQGVCGTRGAASMALDGNRQNHDGKTQMHIMPIQSPQACVSFVPTSDDTSSSAQTSYRITHQSQNSNDHKKQGQDQLAQMAEGAKSSTNLADSGQSGSCIMCLKWYPVLDDHLNSSAVCGASYRPRFYCAECQKIFVSEAFLHKHKSTSPKCFYNSRGARRCKSCLGHLTQGMVQCKDDLLCYVKQISFGFQCYCCWGCGTTFCGKGALREHLTERAGPHCRAWEQCPMCQAPHTPAAAYLDINTLCFRAFCCASCARPSPSSEALLEHYQRASMNCRSGLADQAPTVGFHCITCWQELSSASLWHAHTMQSPQCKDARFVIRVATWRCRACVPCRRCFRNNSEEWRTHLDEGPACRSHCAQTTINLGMLHSCLMCAIHTTDLSEFQMHGCSKKNRLLTTGSIVPPGDSESGGIIIVQQTKWIEVARIDSDAEQTIDRSGLDLASLGVISTDPKMNKHVPFNTVLQQASGPQSDSSGRKSSYVLLKNFEINSMSSQKDRHDIIPAEEMSKSKVGKDIPGGRNSSISRTPQQIPSRLLLHELVTGKRASNSQKTLSYSTDHQGLPLLGIKRKQGRSAFSETIAQTTKRKVFPEMLVPDETIDVSQLQDQTVHDATGISFQSYAAIHNVNSQVEKVPSTPLSIESSSPHEYCQTPLPTVLTVKTPWELIELGENTAGIEQGSEMHVSNEHVIQVQNDEKKQTNTTNSKEQNEIMHIKRSSKHQCDEVSQSWIGIEQSHVKEIVAPLLQDPVVQSSNNLNQLQDIAVQTIPSNVENAYLSPAQSQLEPFTECFQMNIDPSQPSQLQINNGKLPQSLMGSGQSSQYDVLPRPQIENAESVEPESSMVKEEPPEIRIGTVVSLQDLDFAKVASINAWHPDGLAVNDASKTSHVNNHSSTKLQFGVKQNVEPDLDIVKKESFEIKTESEISLNELNRKSIVSTENLYPNPEPITSLSSMSETAESHHCPNCHTDFISHQNLQFHFKKQTVCSKIVENLGRSGFFCWGCMLHYKILDFLRYHLAAHPVCARLHRARALFNRNLRRHFVPQRAHYCEHCREEHLLDASKARMRCRACCALVDSMEELVAHIKGSDAICLSMLREGMLATQCPWCGEWRGGRRNAALHLDACVARTKGARFSCGGCSRSFPFQDMLVAHRMEATACTASGGSSDVQCGKCSSHFDTLSAFEKHCCGRGNDPAE